MEQFFSKGAAFRVLSTIAASLCLSLTFGQSCKLQPDDHDIEKAVLVLEFLTADQIGQQPDNRDEMLLNSLLNAFAKSDSLRLVLLSIITKPPIIYRDYSKNEKENALSALRDSFEDRYQRDSSRIAALGPPVVDFLTLELGRSSFEKSTNRFVRKLKRNGSEELSALLGVNTKSFESEFDSKLKDEEQEVLDWLNGLSLPNRRLVENSLFNQTYLNRSFDSYLEKQVIDELSIAVKAVKGLRENQVKIMVEVVTGEMDDPVMINDDSTGSRFDRFIRDELLVFDNEGVSKLAKRSKGNFPDLRLSSLCDSLDVGRLKVDIDIQGGNLVSTDGFVVIGLDDLHNGIENRPSLDSASYTDKLEDRFGKPVIWFGHKEQRPLYDNTDSSDSSHQPMYHLDLFLLPVECKRPTSADSGHFCFVVGMPSLEYLGPKEHSRLDLVSGKAKGRVQEIRGRIWKCVQSLETRLHELGYSTSMDTVPLAVTVDENQGNPFIQKYSPFINGLIDKDDRQTTYLMPCRFDPADHETRAENAAYHALSEVFSPGMVKKVRARYTERNGLRCKVVTIGGSD